jgi:hypothetical protein
MAGGWAVVDFWDIRSNSRGGLVDIHDALIRERVGKRLAGSYQWSAPGLSLSPNFASGDAIGALVGAGFLQPEA